jgi:hypothetical protein
MSFHLYFKDKYLLMCFFNYYYRANHGFFDQCQLSRFSTALLISGYLKLKPSCMILSAEQC